MWRPAPQPDIVRAAQKVLEMHLQTRAFHAHCIRLLMLHGAAQLQDELYLQQSIDACHDAVMRALGAIPALQHAK